MEIEVTKNKELAMAGNETLKDGGGFLEELASEKGRARSEKSHWAAMGAMLSQRASNVVLEAWRETSVTRREDRRNTMIPSPGDERRQDEAVEGCHGMGVS